MLYMDCQYINAFIDPTGKMDFLGAYCFSAEDRHLLLGKNGNIILLNNSLYQQIMSQDIDSDFWFKLIQRGLALHQDSNPNRFQSKRDVILPTFFMIEMTNGCNMGCRYCSRETFDAKGLKVISNDMLVSVCQYIVKYCKENDLSKIFVQPWGGEPLLEKEKVYQIQNLIRNGGVDVSIGIETNGTLLTEELVRELYERGIGYGISLDGFEAINDMQRPFRNGKGTHQRIVDGLRLTRKYYGNDVSVLTTITKQTVPHIEEVITYFAKELELHRIKMNFVHPSQFSRELGYCVDKEDIKRGVSTLMDVLVWLNEKQIDVMEYNVWLKMMNILTNRERDICLSRGCCGGKDMITFDTNGDIYPCDITDFPEEKIGNIEQEEDLVDAIKNAMEQNNYFIPKKSVHCSSCPWEHFCKGGCSVRAKCSGSAKGTIDYDECIINHTLYPRIIELILIKPNLVNRMTGMNIL